MTFESLTAMFRERRVTRREFIRAARKLGMSYDKIGYILCLSRQRVHQIDSGKIWRGERKRP